MANETKLTLSDFVIQNKFELNSYLSYLLYQFYKNASEQAEDKMVKQ